jgi:tripartite-type tricarboxylate transporter receptor subunit TctC
MTLRIGSNARRALACAAALFALGVQAQDYPSRPVRLIVPFAAGGSSDTVARIIARKVSVAMGETFVIENRPGAGGNIGADYVAKSKPDGYTLLVGAGSTAINVSLYQKLPFDTLKDFDPVIHICTVTGILVTNPTLAAATVPELIALARAQPGRINFASAGSGTVIHLAGELFKSMAKVDITHVPYKGSGPALADLIGGQVQIMFANMPGTLQHVRTGRLRVLAVTSEKRSPLLPDVPTIAEAALPGYKAATWFGVLAPAGTPKEIVARLNAEFARALETRELIDHLGSEGAQATGGSPEWFREFLKADIERWATVVKASGAKAN